MRSSSIKSLIAAASLALTVAAIAPSVQAAPHRTARSESEVFRGGERDFDRVLRTVKRFLKRFGVRATELPVAPVPGPSGRD